MQLGNSVPFDTYARHTPMRTDGRDRLGGHMRTLWPAD